MPADPREVGRWRPTNAHARALGVGILALVAAVVFDRPNAFVLAVPLVVIATWGEVHRPRRPLRTRVRLDRGTVVEGDPVVIHTETDDGGAETVVHVPAHDPWWGRDETPPPAGTVFQQSYRPYRWGYRSAPAPIVYGLGPWLAYGSRSIRSGETTVLVTPRPDQFDPKAPMPHPRGLVGLDRSARRGSGSEFESIHEYRAGDRLRLIHWPTSLRTNRLHVRATYSDEESQVVILIDNTTDVGPADVGPERPTSMDLTLRAAGALVTHHLSRGDRVGLRTIGRSELRLPPTMTGRTWIDPVMMQLATCSRATSIVNQPERLVAGTSASALIVVLSPLLHDDVRTLVGGHLARRAAIIVDTLPRYLGRPAPGAGSTDTAWWVARLRRDATLDALTERGLPVVPWVGATSLDAVLRTIAGRRTGALR